jgi:ABC-2 type transport system ATP-binding protein
VRVCGHDVQARPREAKRAIGYLPEGAPAYPDMTPRGFLEFVARVRGLGGLAGRQRLERVVELVHIGDVLDQRIETLSKGYKRRVGLAQAILHDPPVLIMDEPTDGLDPNQKHEVRELIRRMAAEKVIVLSTHILEEVHAVCTRAIIISSGRIVLDGTPGELEARSRLHNAVVIALRGGPDDVSGQLSGLPGVDAVEPIEAVDGRRSWRVVPARGRSVAEHVAALAHERGWQLEELHVERGRLDDVFREMTTTREPAGSGGAA